MATAKTAATAKAPAASKCATKTAATTEDKGFTLKIVVKLYDNGLNAENVYIAGNIAKLGEWNATKAKAMKTTNHEDYTLSVTGLKKGTEVSFKVLKGLTWEAVEKGINYEDLDNHTITVDGASTIEVGVSNWAC